MKNLNGIIIPAVTPFDESGALRLDMLKDNFARWNTTGAQGIMVLGSNGEFRSLSDDEAFTVIKTASETISKEKTLIAGIGRESLYHTLAFLNRIQKEGLTIDYVSVLTPHYFKSLMTDDALVEYYAAVADASKYPVLLYCAPSFANNVCISREALKRLADHPNIAGIKDTSKDMMNTYMDAVGGRADFEVLSGSLGTIMTCLERGGKGGVVSAANYFPNACAKLCELAKEKGLKAAREYHKQLESLSALTGARASVAGVKATMNLMGYSAGVPRKPVQPCTKELTAEFEQAIKDHIELIESDYNGGLHRI